MLKEALLKQGWAGRTISRAETAERLNPLLKQHRELNHGYTHVINHISDAALADAFRAMQKTARMDVGKLSESILSCGVAAYNGTDLEPGDFDLGADDDTMLFNLLDREQIFLDALRAEAEVEHQMRTRAILGAVLANSTQRLDFLKQQTRKRKRPLALRPSYD